MTQASAFSAAVKLSTLWDCVKAWMEVEEILLYACVHAVRNFAWFEYWGRIHVKVDGQLSFEMDS